MPVVKKTWLIDPALVRRARQICGARTETETVTRALRELVERDRIDRAFRKYGPALSGIESVFPDSVLPPASRQIHRPKALRAPEDS